MCGSGKQISEREGEEQVHVHWSIYLTNSELGNEIMSRDSRLRYNNNNINMIFALYLQTTRQCQCCFFYIWRIDCTIVIGDAPRPAAARMKHVRTMMNQDNS